MEPANVVGHGVGRLSHIYSYLHGKNPIVEKGL